VAAPLYGRDGTMTDPVKPVVVLTGVTGAVGREVAVRAARAPGARVICLIRATSDTDAETRLSQTLNQMTHHPLSSEERSRITAVRGDITEPRLGLQPATWESLAANATRIVHGAANVSWTLPIDEARRINTGGTQEMLRLAHAAARNGRFEAFDYISTVMVAGRRRGLVPEEELDQSAGFWSTYEQSKCEAEAAVWACRQSLPVSVFRLSMVVGDSRSGHTSAFNVMYWPLKMLSRGVFWIVPGDPKGVVDVVPIDYVADAIEIISSDPAQRRRCFHIAAGAEDCCTISDVLDLAVEVMGVRRPILVNPPLFLACVRPFLLAVTWGKRREILRKARVYIPYLSYSAKFDVSRTRSALEPFGLKPPPVRDYFRRLIEYAIAMDWGKRVSATPRRVETEDSA
jgi:thioester reductase-like protein